LTNCDKLNGIRVIKMAILEKPWSAAISSKSTALYSFLHAHIEIANATDRYVAGGGFYPSAARCVRCDVP